MNDTLRQAPFPASASALAPSTRLSGRRLLAARVGWLLLVALTLGPFLVALPSAFASIVHPSPDNAALPPGSLAALAPAGITLDAYAWISIAMMCIVLLVSVALALLLVWRRGDDWVVLLVSAFLVIYTTSNVGIPTNGPSSNPSSISDVVYAVLVSQQNVPAAVIPFAVFLLFPSGRFVPRWSRTLFIAVFFWAIGISVLPTMLGGVLFLGYPLFIGATIACMVYRYRRGSTPGQQQQTKWVIVGLVASLLANQAFWFPTQFTSLGQTLYPPLFYLAYQLVLLLVPVTFFIAIQRYRLYDIDTIINRALVYGSLTAVLGAVYAAGVIGARTLVGAVIHEATAGQPLVIVGTTLLIAALFNPLRRRIQVTVDRRFYRRRYDAAKTLAAFSTVLRQDVDLAVLQEHLLEAVNDAMQPSHASLLLMTQPLPEQSTSGRS